MDCNYSDKIKKILEEGKKCNCNPVIIGPTGPVHPTKSVKNNQNIENKGIEAHSRYTFFGTKSKKELRF